MFFQQVRTVATVWSPCHHPNWCPCRARPAGRRWPTITEVASADTTRCRPWTRLGSARNRRSYRQHAWVARWAPRRPPTISPGKRIHLFTRGTDPRCEANVFYFIFLLLLNYHSFEHLTPVALCTYRWIDYCILFACTYPIPKWRSLVFYYIYLRYYEKNIIWM